VVELNIKSPGSGLVIDDLLVVVNLGSSNPLLVLEISSAALDAGVVVPIPIWAVRLIVLYAASSAINVLGFMLSDLLAKFGRSFVHYYKLGD
jgi:hypothetical protein